MGELLFILPGAPTSKGGFRCHICSVSISRSLYFDIFPNSPDDKFLSIGNISSTSKPELFFWSLIVMSGLLVSLFLSVCTAKSQRIVALSVSTMDSSLCSFQLLDSHYKVTDQCLLDQHQLVKLVVGIGHPEVYFPGFLFSVWVPLS